MSARVSAYVATSRDGFIARIDGGIDWLNDASASVPEGEDCGYQAFMDTVDVLIMGRKTYEQVLSFGEWPYGETPVVVLSSSAVTFPDELPGPLSHSSETPHQLYDRLSEAGAKHMYVDGGVTIQRFLAQGLLDEITITVIPVVLGEGIPLFGPVEAEVQLNHVDTVVFDCGFVQTRYAIVKEFD